MLSEELATKMRAEWVAEMMRSGLSRDRLLRFAKKYRCSVSTVRNVLRRKAWRCADQQ